MVKSKVIRTIIESCREPGPRGARTLLRAVRRSPAAGGGLSGAVPPTGAPAARGTLRDPRLGQSLKVRRGSRRG
ncbi:MAG: hypothetical protein AUI52_06665 [Acidobacteria bacterium 13_1_40CM_2_68_10]|nr:MAG: hypothetical protein AUI52_06665 [Acidobacteria bacterium 13_1_40CM_2_68_10]OLE64729.1 MAG: hypothetical protein AUG03_08040 [Acidobacteria bacterium 13_1_20CM_2_68_14]